MDSSWQALVSPGSGSLTVRQKIGFYHKPRTFFVATLGGRKKATMRCGSVVQAGNPQKDKLEVCEASISRVCVFMMVKKEINLKRNYRTQTVCL